MTKGVHSQMVGCWDSSLVWSGDGQAHTLPILPRSFELSASEDLPMPTPYRPEKMLAAPAVAPARGRERTSASASAAAIGAYPVSTASRAAALPSVAFAVTITEEDRQAHGAVRRATMEMAKRRSR